METKYAYNGDIKIAYETVGDPKNETIIFICGLGSQLVFWTDEFCQPYLDRGFHVIRFDNRDVGLSHKTEGTPPDAASIRNSDLDTPIDAPYTLSDMAADTITVLDAAGVDKAHVVGTSLGGTIAQTVAIEHPHRVHTLTSIMSAPSSSTMLSDTEDKEREEAIAASVTVDVSNPDTYIDLQIEGWRVTSGPHFDAAYQRAIIQRSFERCYHPEGWAFQMMAVATSGGRVEKLKKLTMPALVIHGKLDPLIPTIGGELTADAIPNAKLMIVEDMGHNFPRPRWPEIADAITGLARQVNG